MFIFTILEIIQHYTLLFNKKKKRKRAREVKIFNRNRNKKQLAFLKRKKVL